MIIKIVFSLIFVVSLYKTIQLCSVFLNRERHLTEKGHRNLGLALTGLIISSLQLFEVLDFIKFIGL